VASLSPPLSVVGKICVHYTPLGKICVLIYKRSNKQP
jgi:hypothetical protein